MLKYGYGYREEYNIMDYEVIIIADGELQDAVNGFENSISPADVCGGFAVNSCD